MGLIPISQSYIDAHRNVSNNKPVSVENNCNNSGIQLKPPIENDVYDNSAKKTNNNKLKKILICAGIAAGVACATVFAVKMHNQSKLKKLIVEQYDKLANEMAERCKANGLDFVKPELRFKRCPEKVHAQYLLEDNSIQINTRYLSLKNFYKNIDDEICMSSIGNTGHKQYSIFHFLTPKEAKEGFIKGNLSEFIVHKTATLAHELEHAKQLQFSLHAEGAQDHAMQLFKKAAPNLSEKDIKELYPFIFSFSPKKKISLNDDIVDKTLGYFKFPNGDLKYDPGFFQGCENKNGEVVYRPILNPKAILECLIRPADADDSFADYITNFPEVLARNAELIAAQNLKGFNGVDDKTMEKFIKTKKYNLTELVKILFKV